MPTLDFDIRWRPFQLNAQAPEGKGVNKLDMYKKKFGADRVATVSNPVIDNRRHRCVSHHATTRHGQGGRSANQPGRH